MKKLFFFLFLLLNISTFAQTYPVQIVAVMTPPHSSKIADYANPMGNRIHLQLITTDLSVQNRAITLHLEIKGNGISAVSSPLSTGIPNLRISGGEILSLIHSELAHYFQLRNLQGITTEQYANVLPDGVYSFCFRVKDATSGQWLSQNQCTMAYLMLNDPPLLNIPSDNEQVQVSDFQNILFSWTPRQINAVNVAYAFELREILDPNLDPKFAFEVSRKVHFEENLRTTTFVYDVSKPNLVPGRRYAWRIKAASTGALAENSVFKNNGYSEIRSFVYAVNCSKPAFLLSQQQGKTSVKLLWQGNTSHQKYHIQYRKKGVENAQWFESFTRNTQTIIANLQSGAEYEFRVGASCEAERYGTTPSFAYADIQTFSIEKQEKSNENSYNCGIVPKIEITNQKPLASLIANEVFTAGDFPVQVLEAQGSNGVFSGKGFIKVPYLNDTKLSVSFENVKINTDNQLIEGVVKTTYDPEWKNVQFVQNLKGQGNTAQEISISFEVEKIESVNGELVVIGKDGRKEVFPGGKDTTLISKTTTTDENGKTQTQEKIYYVDKEGNASEPQAIAQGGKPSKDNTQGVDKNGVATDISAKGIEVFFENTANSKYAFEAPNRALTQDYKKIDGKFIPFKAVIKGESEEFLAKVVIKNKEISADSLIFKTQNGTQIQAQRLENSDDYLLNLKGLHSFAVEQVQATIKQGKKYQIAGVFNLVHLSPRTQKVKLIPTSQNIKKVDIEQIKQIYSKVGVDLQIETENIFDISNYLTNNVLETKDVFGDLTDYSPAQQQIITQFKNTQNIDNQAYYLFLTDAKSSTGQSGYMALGGQFGFVFDNSERTIAHELGHGIFKLEHPFKDKSQAGKTASIMDYGSGTDFLFSEWKQIGDPEFKIGILQGQEEGEYSKYAHLGLTPDGAIFDEFYLDNSPISVTINVSNEQYTINKIEYKQEKYTWNTEKQAFVKGNETITIKKIRKTTGKVNIYRNRKDGGCSYDYLTINWSQQDKNTKNIVGQINLHIKKYSEKDWKIAPFTIRDESCNKIFFSELLKRDLKECDYSEITEGTNILITLSQKDAIKADAIVSQINSFCMGAIRNLPYSTIEKLFNIVASQETIKEHSEVALLRLMTAIKTTSYPDFYTYLEKDNNKVLKHLIKEIDDVSPYFWTDKENYTNFIGALGWMLNKMSIANKWNIADDDFYSRVVNLNPIEYQSDFSDFFTPSFTLKYNDGIYDENSGNITINDKYKTYNYNGFDKGTGQTIITHTEKIEELSPLTPIIIVPETDKLPLIATALGEHSLGNNAYIVPAIFLKYNADKIRNDNTVKGVVIALDIATITLSGGTALATKVHLIYRVWALMEVAGAVGNIAVNTTNVSPEMKQVVDTYNLAMGVIGIKNIGKGGYKFVKNLPNETKQILQSNGSLREVFREYHLNFKSKFSRVKASGEYDNLDNITKDHLNKQEQVLDDLAKTTNVTKSTFTQEQINSYVLKSTKNITKDKVLLGKFEGIDNPNSYNNRAKKEGYIYFELDDWDEAYKIVQNDDEMWKINKEFILNLKNNNIPFYLSHNPTDPKYVKGFYKREIELLTSPISNGGLGGRIETVIEGTLWKVIF